jgi:hypothetical protein
MVHDPMHLCFYFVDVPPDWVPPFFCLDDLLCASEGSVLCVSALGLDALETPDFAEAGLG